MIEIAVNRRYKRDDQKECCHVIGIQPTFLKDGHNEKADDVRITKEIG